MLRPNCTRQTPYSAMYDGLTHQQQTISETNEKQPMNKCDAKTSHMMTATAITNSSNNNKANSAAIMSKATATTHTHTHKLDRYTRNIVLLTIALCCGTKKTGLQQQQQQYHFTKQESNSSIRNSMQPR